MPDAETAALLRAVLDELCASVSLSGASTGNSGASKLIETVEQGSSSADDLQEAGKETLRRPPTMWR